jgi:hypothetical protein
MNLAVSSIEPGLDWDEEEHDNDTDDEVEVSKISADDSVDLVRTNDRLMG